MPESKRYSGGSEPAKPQGDDREAPTHGNTTSILEGLGVFFTHGSVVEIRILKTPYGTMSGYFDNVGAAARVLELVLPTLSGQATCYATLNPVSPTAAVQARAANYLKANVASTTSDAEILRRHYFLIDVDPVRPPDTSSTGAELQLALRVRDSVADWLDAQGWPAPIRAKSGNGGHLLYRIDLPNDDPSRDLIKDCLGALIDRFSTSQVAIDPVVYNAARICKVYGTLARKGDNTAERPHRLASVEECPSPLLTVTAAQLLALAAQNPKRRAASGRPRTHAASWGTRLDMVAEFKKRGWYRRPIREGWHGVQCPWVDQHSNNSGDTETALREPDTPSDRWGFKCQHAHCADRTIRDVYLLLGDDSAPPEGPTFDHEPVEGAPVEGDEEEDLPPLVHSSPAPLSSSAYIGVFGAIVQALAPHTEADPIAILLQLLAMFGNVIGRTAHFFAEADVHFLNLFVVLVGQTAKSRKGVSAGHASRVFKTVDTKWASDCNASGLSTGEGLMHAIRDPVTKEVATNGVGAETNYKTEIVDHGVSDKRLYTVEAEFASLLKVMQREGNTLSPIVRKAWDGKDLRSLTKSNPLKATQPHVTIVGHITEQEVKRLLNQTESANGFANRFCWAWVQRARYLPDGGKPVRLDDHIKQLCELVAQARDVGEMRRDAEASHLWHRIYRRLSAGRPGLLGSLTARGEAQVMRVACLYALGDGVREVQRRHLEAALEVWRYCYDSVGHVWGHSLGDAPADALLAALKDAGASGLTRSQIINVVFQRNLKVKELSRVIKLLQDANLVICRREPSRGGRPAERWFYVPNHYGDNGESPTDDQSTPSDQFGEIRSDPVADDASPFSVNSVRSQPEDAAASSVNSVRSDSKSSPSAPDFQQPPCYSLEDLMECRDIFVQQQPVAETTTSAPDSGLHPAGGHHRVRDIGYSDEPIGAMGKKEAFEIDVKGIRADDPDREGDDE